VSGAPGESSPAEARPHAVIVAGPNGAGKSTLAPKLLAQEFGIRIYVNPDVIAQGLAGFDPASAAIRAGRILLQRLEELRLEGESFAVESTISGRSLQRVVRTLNASGYHTHLVYLWLPEPSLAVERVGNRVRLGGHHVPEADIRRRFSRSVANFEKVYRRITHEWRVYHALKPLQDPEPRLIARGAGDAVIAILDEDAWLEIQEQANAIRGGDDEIDR
jgi:predicted ABC-type ATPase